MSATARLNGIDTKAISACRECRAFTMLIIDGKNKSVRARGKDHSVAAAQAVCDQYWVDSEWVEGAEMDMPENVSMAVDRLL